MERFPWSNVKPGGSFFIASLTPVKTREEGLKDALRSRVWAKGKVGLLHGLHGVLFTRDKERKWNK